MKGKIDFQGGRHGGHLGLQIGTILVIFDLQVTRIFSRWLRGHLGFRSEQFQLFLICKLPRYFLSIFESVGLSVHETKGKQIFKIAAIAAILDF